MNCTNNKIKRDKYTDEAKKKKKKRKGTRIEKKQSDEQKRGKTEKEIYQRSKKINK